MTFRAACPEQIVLFLNSRPDNIIIGKTGEELFDFLEESTMRSISLDVFNEAIQRSKYTFTIDYRKKVRIGLKSVIQARVISHVQFSSVIDNYEQNLDQSQTTDTSPQSDPLRIYSRRLKNFNGNWFSMYDLVVLIILQRPRTHSKTLEDIIEKVNEGSNNPLTNSRLKFFRSKNDDGIVFSTKVLKSPWAKQSDLGEILNRLIQIFRERKGPKLAPVVESFRAKIETSPEKALEFTTHHDVDVNDLQPKSKRARKGDVQVKDKYCNNFVLATQIAQVLQAIEIRQTHQSSHVNSNQPNSNSSNLVNPVSRNRKCGRYRI